MNAISKATAFPPTVQPGIPKLPPLPTGWIQEPIGNYLKEVRRPIKMADDCTYRLVTVKRARGGVVEREELSGRDISVKSQFEIREGDFLISKRQIVHGACGIVPLALSRSIVSNEYAVLAPTAGLDLRFLGYLAHSTYFQQTCFHSSIGVHIEKMIFKLDRWLGWEFNLPPFPEQKKIAEILSTWDRAIETTEKLLANAEAQKKALMQQLLTGKRRLKGFDGEWREVRLGDIAYVDQSSLSSKTPGDFSFRYISLSDVAPGRIADELPRFQFADAPSRARRKVSPGDILFATVRPNLLGFARVKNEHHECIASTGFAVVSCKKIADPGYVYHYLFSHHMRSQIHGLVVGSNYPAVNSSEVKRLRLHVPPLEEQKAISSIIDTADQSTALALSQIEMLKAEKRALMQQLLTGERRVAV